MTRIRNQIRCWLAAAALGVASASPVAAQEIVAGSLPSSPPMIFFAEDGKTAQGALIDLAAGLAQRLNRPIVFRTMSFPSLMPALQAKRIDIVLSLMADTPERQKVIDFVDFYRVGTKMLIKKGNPEKITGLDSLCGKTVAVLQGSTQLEIVTQASEKCVTGGKPAVSNLQYASAAEAELQVQTGRVVAFLGTSTSMAHLARTVANGNAFDLVAEEYQPVTLGIGIERDNTVLRDQIRAALDSMIADGSYRKIFEKYGIESGVLSRATINLGSAAR